MNSSGVPIPELIPRGSQILLNRGNGMAYGRHSLPGSGGAVLGGGQQIVTTVGGGQSGGGIRRLSQPPPQGKLMRLRCRFRPLHDAYIRNGTIVEDDADVIFICGDGHQLKAHKVIMASSSKFFAKAFEDQTHQTAVVSVPDVKVDVMKIILHLTYRDRVILTMRQIKEVGEFITAFGMQWTQFGYEEYTGDEPNCALPLPAIPMVPVVLSVPAKEQPSSGDEDDVKILDQGDARHSRKSRLTLRAGTEGEEFVEQEEQEDPEVKIKEWMSNLGKREAALHPPPQAPNVPPKRMKVDGDGSKLSCSVCQQSFQTETAFRWHEDRHVGHKMFKCKFCDVLSETPKACWAHERDGHSFSGLQFVNQQQQQAPQVSSASPPRPVARANPIGVSRFVSSPGQVMSKKIKLGLMKKAAQRKRLPNHPSAPVLASIEIGNANGSDQLDSKKLKQLHWLYVCQRCENCADSAGKAQLHYATCYSEQEARFEDTVTKYRQGFYGKSSCPLCPRRYPQNSGFLIHCGHQHQLYRKLFVHVGGTDDHLKCNTCKNKFPDPTSFHDHLDRNVHGVHHCTSEKAEEAPIPEPVAPVKAPETKLRPLSEGKVTRPRPPRRPDSPMESKSYKVQFHTPPRSARLASRVQAEQANQKQAAKLQEQEKRVESDIDFPAVDCPVCGDSDLPNISLHLKTKHKDLNVEVTRISSELLRCKGCTITFDICDLLDHKNCLSGNAEEEPEPIVSRRSSTSALAQAAVVAPIQAAKQKIVKPTPIQVDVEHLPPGVGQSPIEKIEIDDLLSIGAIRNALKCQICGFTAKRLGIVGDCLRSHGIHRCSLCFNSYASKSDYAQHLKKCHGSGSNKLKCPLCVKSFQNVGQTSGHMYSTHWLVILRQHENNLLEEAEEAMKAEKQRESEKQGVEKKGDRQENKSAQEEDESDETEKTNAMDDNQAEVVEGVVVRPPDGGEEEDDDDEGKMEIDETPQNGEK